MRTATTKTAEVMSFEKLSSISIIIGATKTLYKRHSVLVWEFVACVEFVAILWDKLG